MSSVYEPREDSQYLASFVRTHARGRTLDVGTGSGIQAFTALENEAVTDVIAVDINPLAVDHVTQAIKELPEERRLRITVLKGDMFSAIKDEKFDTIICNPPYLPQDEDDQDPALYGGNHGYEWSVRFLQEAKAHIAPNGQMLFLFSSLTNRDRVDLELKHLGYHHEQLGILAQFFEQLYVYRIWM